MSKRHTPEQIAKAEKVVAQIKDKVDAALAPIALEMKIMEWRPEYRRIVWEAVMHEAMKRARDCA